MVAVLVFGLVAITFLLMAMKMVGLNLGQIMAFTILSFLIMLLIESMFIFQMFRSKRSAEEPALLEKQATNELEAAQVRVLPEAMPSVTEHTTRSFEPLYRERK